MTLETMRDLLVYGAGGFGREVAWLAADHNRGVDVWRVVGYVDDAKSGRGATIHDVPILHPDEARVCYPHAAVALAVGNPAIRAKLADEIHARGFPEAMLVHPDTRIGPHVEIGDGAVICAGCTLTTDITIGRQVQINLHCTVGHDAVLGDFVTLAPGVHVSGNVHLERGVYVGTGASIINGREDQPLVIGAGAVIGAQACVTKSVPPGQTWVGVPATAKTRHPTTL